jgi:ATP-dependent helicase STH1/SNF2
MKKAFLECYKAVLACEDENGRKRCELFRELPDKRDYPDYYRIISHPIAMSQLRKRGNSNYYKSVNAFRDDWRLMFNNARTYNQEGSWVYVDAVEMEKVYNATWDRVIAGTDFPGAPLHLLPLVVDLDPLQARTLLRLHPWKRMVHLLPRGVEVGAGSKYSVMKST